MANRSQLRQIRAIIASNSRLDSQQLKTDLASDRSLVVSTTATVGGLKSQLEQTQFEAILLDADLAGQQTPTLISEVLQTAKTPILVRAAATSNQLLLDCLDAGAIGIVDKPATVAQTAELIPGLIWNLHAAARASIENASAIRSAPWPAVSSMTSDGILAIGGGLGSHAALAGILSQLPPDAPGAVVIAPLHNALLPAFAERIKSRCRMIVRLAAQGDLIRPGQILIAPGDSHVLVRPSPGGFTVALKAGPSVFNQRPSIEMLFGSLADIAGAGAVAVLLGGGGVDGVAGLLSLKNRGGSTIAESSVTSVLRDAPNLATACKAADAVEPAWNIAAKVIEFTATRQTLRAA